MGFSHRSLHQKYRQFFYQERAYVEARVRYGRELFAFVLLIWLLGGYLGVGQSKSFDTQKIAANKFTPNLLQNRHPDDKHRTRNTKGTASTRKTGLVACHQNGL